VIKPGDVVRVTHTSTQHMLVRGWLGVVLYKTRDAYVVDRGPSMFRATADHLKLADDETAARFLACRIFELPIN